MTGGLERDGAGSSCIDCTVTHHVKPDSCFVDGNDIIRIDLLILHLAAAEVNNLINGSFFLRNSCFPPEGKNVTSEESKKASRLFD